MIDELPVALEVNRAIGIRFDVGCSSEMREDVVNSDSVSEMLFKIKLGLGASTIRDNIIEEMC